MPADPKVVAQVEVNRLIARKATLPAQLVAKQAEVDAAQALLAGRQNEMQRLQDEYDGLDYTIGIFQTAIENENADGT